MNWISNSQYGCLAKTSNSLALADATNYVSSYLDKHDYTMDRFVEVKKAFDTVDRSYDKKKWTIMLYGIYQIFFGDNIFIMFTMCITMYYKTVVWWWSHIWCTSKIVIWLILFNLYINDIVDVSNFVLSYIVNIELNGYRQISSI